MFHPSALVAVLACSSWCSVLSGAFQPTAAPAIPGIGTSTTVRHRRARSAAPSRLVAKQQENSISVSRLSSLTALSMAKKRRRRRAANPETQRSSPPPSAGDASGADDLPDFELEEDGAVGSGGTSASSSSSSSSRSLKTPPSMSSSVTDASLLDGQVTANMMGTSDKPARSVEDLIADRRLESKFEFDDDAASAADDSLPDLASLAARSSSQPLPTTTSRKAARKAAAIARAQTEQEEEEENFLEKIPFLLGEDGKVKPTKVLEAGTWLGIFILVAWEVYINSPLFERAAPISPIVY